MSLISYVSWWGVRVMEGDGECYVCLPHRVLLLVKVDIGSHFNYVQLVGCPGDGECYVCLPHQVLLLVKVDNASHFSYVSWWGVRWWDVRVMWGVRVDGG